MQQLGTGNWVESIAVQGSDIFWASKMDGTIMKAPIAGGEQTTLASDQVRPVSIAVDSKSVYWVNESGGDVSKVPIGGGATTTLATGYLMPEGITVDKTSVYWTAGVCYEGPVMKLTPK